MSYIWWPLLRLLLSLNAAQIQSALPLWLCWVGTKAHSWYVVQSGQSICWIYLASSGEYLVSPAGDFTSIFHFCARRGLRLPYIVWAGGTGLVGLDELAMPHYIHVRSPLHHPGMVHSDKIRSFARSSCLRSCLGKTLGSS